MKRLIHALLIATFLATAGLASLTTFWFAQKSRRADPAHLPPIRCAGIQPLEGEAFDGRIVWYFNKTLAPLAGADARDVLTITPALPGRVMAEGAHLIFQPDDAPAPGTIYEIQLSDLIRGADGSLVEPGSRQFVFPAFKFTADQMWEVENRPGLRMWAIRFPAPVHPRDLKAALTLKDASQVELDTMVSPGDDDRTIHIAIQGDHEPPFSIEVAKGLQDASGRVVMRRPKIFTHDSDSAKSPDEDQSDHDARKFAVEWANFRPVGRDGLFLSLGSSWNVSPEEIESNLVLEPPLRNIRVERRYAGAFSIYGDWASNTTYNLIFEPGLQSVNGRILDAPVRSTARTPREVAYLGFADKGLMFFPRRPDASLVVESRNAAQANIRVARVFASNLPHALEDMRGGQVQFNFSDKWCETVGELTLPLPPGKDRLQSTVVPLDRLIPNDAPGVYVVQADTDPGEPARGWYWDGDNADTKIILATNIGVLAHWTDEELALLVHELGTLDPLTSATVSVYSSKNQLMASGRADGEGMLRLRDFEARLGEPKLLVVEQGSDFTFLDLSPRQEDTAGMSNSWPRYNLETYDAFMHADRDLIRPGETLHVRWIVGAPGGESAAGVPLLFRVVKPDGRTLLESPVTLSEFASGGYDVETLKAHPTGVWRAELLVPGEEKPVGQYAFHVEEFVPNRLVARVEAVAAQWRAGDKQRLTVHGEHLTGVPATGRKASAEVRLSADLNFTFDQWEGFRFGNDDAPQPESISLGESQLNNAGAATFTFDTQTAASSGAQWTSPVKATVLGRVFELGGRVVMGRAEATYFPSAVCLGVAAWPAPEPGVIEVEAAAVAPDGEVAELDEVEISLEKKTWRYHMRRYYTHNEPTWVEEYETVETRRMPLRDGRARAAFAVERWAQYRVRAHSPQTPQTSTVAFYSSGGVCRVVDASRPELLQLSLDAGTVPVGGEARLRLEAPFDGKVFVALQNAGIRETFVTELVNQTAEISIPVRGYHWPNVWIEATLIHGLDREHGQAFPFSSFAKTMLRVDDPARRVNVAFGALPEEVAPSESATFDILLSDADGRPVQGEITLAAVDEGIHSITNYANPDPAAWLLRERRPDLRRTHYYDRVAFDFDKPLPGGDGRRSSGMAGDVADRLAGDAASWIAPVALWSGAVKTDPDGRASVTLSIPDYTGRLRLVAVAAGANGSMGAAAEGIYVRRPFDLEIALPRFLLPGDAAHPIVQVRNFTDEPVSASLAWELGGALESAASERSLDLAPNGTTVLPVTLNTAQSAGDGRIHWTATFRNAADEIIYAIERDTPVPVHPAATFESRPLFGVLEPGEETTIAADEFMAAPEPWIHVTAGANPLLRLQGSLTSLVEYPYGCVEQTTSRLMPMFVLRRHEELTRLAMGTESAPLRDYLQAGIDRLFAMQTASGGLAYWPGQSEPSDYGSVYALHFLTLAQADAGLELPAAGMSALKDYVLRQIVFDSRANQDESLLYLRGYGTFVLSLDGNLEAIQQIERFENLTLPRPARLLLGAALASQSPNSDRVKLFLAGPSAPYAVKTPDDTLASDVRNKAVEFMALSRMPVTPAQDLAMRAQELMNWMESERFASTHEQAFVTTALAEYLGRLADNVNSAGGVMAFAGQQFELAGAESIEKTIGGGAGAVTIRNTGAADLFINARINGIPLRQDNATLSDGIEIIRTVYDDGGRVVALPVYEHGRSYIVEISVRCPDTRRDLLVVDRLPAGFEVENTRLAPDLAPLAGLKVNTHPAMLELRDDRVIAAFDRLRPGLHHYSYVARAVTPGRFAHPPAQAECMYQPFIRARTAPATAEVRPENPVTGAPVAEIQEKP